MMRKYDKFIETQHGEHHLNVVRRCDRGKMK